MLSAELRRPGPSGGRRQGLRRRLRYWLLAAGGLLVAGLCAGWIAWRLLGGEAAALAGKPPSTTAYIERHRATGATPQWSWVSWSDISDELKVAVLVAEDIEFFSHAGFSTSEIRIAIEQHLREGRRLRGASTITQQLARNLWLSSDRSFLRKGREAFFTVALERKLRKRRILELYLNVAEFHPGIFGAEAASRHFFDKPAADLDRREAALLAASLPSSAWHPGSENASFQRHAARVEARIGEAGWIRRLL